jgi:RNA polymerase sigma factor (sigma-70 family)
MNVDWTYDGCDAEDEQLIERLWEAQQAELEAKVAELSLDPPEFRIAVTHNSEPDVWELQAALHLTTRTLVSENRGHALQPVFEKMVADLAQAIDREGDEPTEAVRRLQGLEAVVPLLNRNRADGRSYQFFYFLGPLMQSLRIHAARELEMLELEGTLTAEGVEVDDVLDEALLRAWDRFETRPPELRFDLWLIGLIHEVLDTYAGEVPHESLQTECDVALPEQDEQSSSITWVEQATYPETIELGDLLPGTPGVEAWDRLDFETKQTQLAELLTCLSREQRQILVLHGVEGFDTEQIAALQERSVQAVQSDLDESRKQLAAALKKPDRNS